MLDTWREIVAEVPSARPSRRPQRDCKATTRSPFEIDSGLLPQKRSVAKILASRVLVLLSVAACIPILVSLASYKMASHSPAGIWSQDSPILAAVGAARIFNDSKDFVDAPLLVDPSVAWTRWSALPQPPKREALQNFVDATFGPPDSLLEPWVPPDFVTDPPLLQRLPGANARAWAKALNGMWLKLGRKVPASLQPDRTTLLPAAHGFVVPGGRFREAYYWDSYWIVLGLLAVDMRQTAASLTENLLDAVRSFGFVPNGLRSYYLNRSQPPMLTQMVAEIVGYDEKKKNGTEAAGAEAAGTEAATERSAYTCGGAVLAQGGAEKKEHREVEHVWLREVLPVLEVEYRWWMQDGANGSSVALPVGTGSQPARLNRYVVVSNAPRVESWAEDKATASSVPEAERPRVYSELAAGAESGWDFSTRWLSDAWGVDDRAGADGAGRESIGGALATKDATKEPPEDAEESATTASTKPSPLASIRTSAVLPVELNSILYRNERTLQRLHAMLASAEREVAAACAEADGVQEGGESQSALEASVLHAAAAERYGAAAAARLTAMDAWMWDEQTHRWHDVEWASGRKIPAESAASYVPLWAGAHNASQAAAAAAALANSPLFLEGGVSTTRNHSGQQWDAPNAWPPLQQWLIQGLRDCGASSAAPIARTLATRWLRSNWLGWNRTGHMHEKYDATRPGERGGGGEYTPQVGFGWTNGVVLWILDQYAQGGGESVLEAIEN